jgi:general secretion pathway protein C
MKQWPLAASFILFIALCASVAYWALQVFTPPVRPATAPPQATRAAPSLDAAAGLFGGRSNVALASNFQLKGVIVSGNPANSVAILATDGKPPQAIRANSEVMPGVTIKEVHRQYVLLSDGGVIKRVELPEEAQTEGTMAMSERAPAPAPARTAPAAPPRVVVSPPPQAQQPAPPNIGVPPAPAAAAPAPNIPQQTAIPGGVAMPANASTPPPSMDMGGSSLGYNPAGSQATSPPPQAPSPAASSMRGAMPGQPVPVPQSVPQTQPVPGAPAAPMQQR